MPDDYEQGYQDGQADIEEEIVNAFLGVYSVDLRLDTVLGHETATLTIHTTRDSALYGFLQRHIRRLATESVVGSGDQMLDSQLSDQKTTETAPKTPKSHRGIDIHAAWKDEITSATA